MIICDYFDVITAPFPFSDILASKPRPAVCLSSKAYNKRNGETIVCMITSAVDTKWHDDVFIKDIKSAGLPIPSFIRPKIGSIDNKLIKRIIGKLSAADKKALKDQFSKILCV